MPEWTTVIVTALGSGALASVVTAILTRRPALVTAEAAAQDQINKGFANLVSELSEQLREARAAMAQMQGEMRDLSQHLQSLEGILREANIPVPPRTRPAPLSLVTGAHQS